MANDLDLVEQLQSMGLLVQESRNTGSGNATSKKLPGSAVPRIAKRRPNVQVDYCVEVKLCVNDKYAIYRLRVDYSVIDGEYQPRIGVAVNKLLAMAPESYRMVELICPGPNEAPAKERHCQLAEYALTLDNPKSYYSADDMRVQLRIALSQQPAKLAIRFAKFDSEI